MKKAESNTHHLKNTKSELSAGHKKGFCRQRLWANVGANPINEMRRCETTGTRLFSDDTRSTSEIAPSTILRLREPRQFDLDEGKSRMNLSPIYCIITHLCMNEFLY
jgi:hypothetical protein